jgi:hypothetical protein
LNFSFFIRQIYSFAPIGSNDIREDLTSASAGAGYLAFIKYLLSRSAARVC